MGPQSPDHLHQGRPPAVRREHAGVQLDGGSDLGLGVGLPRERRRRGLEPAPRSERLQAL